MGLGDALRRKCSTFPSPVMCTAGCATLFFGNVGLLTSVNTAERQAWHRSCTVSVPAVVWQLQGASLKLGGWWIFWVMCCDPWLSVQTRVCSVPALARAIPCVCRGWGIQACPTAGNCNKNPGHRRASGKPRCAHGCWLSPDCCWTVPGAQFVKPQGRPHCGGLFSFIPIGVASSGVSAAQALLPHPLPWIPLASPCLQILLGSWAQAFQTRAAPSAGLGADSGSCGEWPRTPAFQQGIWKPHLQVNSHSQICTADKKRFALTSSALLCAPQSVRRAEHSSSLSSSAELRLSFIMSSCKLFPPPIIGCCMLCVCLAIAACGWVCCVCV